MEYIHKSFHLIKIKRTVLFQAAYDVRTNFQMFVPRAVAAIRTKIAKFYGQNVSPSIKRLGARPG